MWAPNLTFLISTRNAKLFFHLWRRAAWTGPALTPRGNGPLLQELLTRSFLQFARFKTSEDTIALQDISMKSLNWSTVIQTFNLIPQEEVWAAHWTEWRLSCSLNRPPSGQRWPFPVCFGTSDAAGSSKFIFSYGVSVATVCSCSQTPPPQICLQPLCWHQH